MGSENSGSGGNVKRNMGNGEYCDGISYNTNVGSSGRYGVGVEGGSCRGNGGYAAATFSVKFNP